MPADTGAGQRVGQLGADLSDDVLEVDAPLHAGELAAAVHEDDGAAGFGDGEGEARIGQGADVVDQVGAGRERALGHRALARVHGDRRVGGAAHGFEDGKEAGDLLFGRDLGGPGAVDPAARPGRFGPEVQQVGALFEHAQSALGCSRRIGPQSAVAEGVGGEVQDAQDPRASPVLRG